MGESSLTAIRHGRRARAWGPDSGPSTWSAGSGARTGRGAADGGRLDPASSAPNAIAESQAAESRTPPPRDEDRSEEARPRRARGNHSEATP